MIPSTRRPQIPLAQGQTKPLTVDLLKQAGEAMAGKAGLDTKALSSTSTLGRPARIQRTQEVLTGLRVLLNEEFGKSTATLRPALGSVTSAEKMNVARALGVLSDEEVAALEPGQLAETLASAARMVNRFESSSRNFAEGKMKRPDEPLTASDDIHKCAYGLMNFALAEAAEDEDLAHHRMDRRDQVGMGYTFQPDFRATCMERFRAAMDGAQRVSGGPMTPAQIQRVVDGVIKGMKRDFPPPAKLPSMDAWEEVAEQMDAKHHRASVAGPSGPASPASRTSPFASSSASPAPEAEPPMSEEQRARRKKLGLEE